MFAVVFIPSGKDVIAGFKKTGFVSRDEALQWIIDNHSCQECKRSQELENNHCVGQWKIYDIEEYNRIQTHKRTIITLFESFIHKLSDKGVSKRTMNQVLEELYRDACVNSASSSGYSEEEMLIYSQVASLLEESKELFDIYSPIKGNL